MLITMKNSDFYFIFVSRNPERTESSLDHLGKYHDQLVCLEQKIPAAEIQVWVSTTYFLPVFREDKVMVLYL
jgi:hypothetical protein